MTDVLFSLLIFSTAFIVHLAIHRILYFQKKKSIFILFIYIFFLIPLAYLISNFPKSGFIFDSKLPITAFVLYILLFGIMVVLYLPYIFGGKKVPATTILQAFEKKEILAKKDIRTLFSESLFIEPRLLMLSKKGYILQDSARYKLTQKGKCVYFIIKLLVFLLGINPGG